jgi:YD repeat-containing protein
MFDIVNGGRLIAQTDTLGNTTSYGYDVGGFVSVVYDPLGQKTESGKDVRGNTIRSTTCSFQGSEVGDECQTVYYKLLARRDDGAAHPDARNDQLIEILDARSTGPTDPTYRTQFAYDTSGNRTSMTTPPVPGYPSGRTTTLTYTTATTPAVGGGFTPPGLPLTTRSAGGREQRTEYNAAGDAVRLTDPAGLVTEFTFDGLGRASSRTVISTAYPDGQVTTYRYEADDLVETTEPPVTNAVTGAVHTARTADVFDADGNVTSRTVSDLTGGDSPRAVGSSYNNLGQLVKSVDPTGAVTIYEYDPYGRQVKAVACDSDPAPSAPCPGGDVLRSVVNAFDSEGQLLTVTHTGRDGTVTQLASNAYYADGTLASETDAMNWTTKYEYYHNGRLKKVTRTDGVKSYVVQENAYDNAGNPWSRVENNGATRTLFYFDAAGRMQSSTVVIDDTERAVNYTYDADDNVLAARNTAAGAVLAYRRKHL